MKKNLVIVVTGGRDFEDRDAVFNMLGRIHEARTIAVLGHGDCPTGADKWADEWAEENGVQRVKFPAPWKKGKSAGPFRNKVMLHIMKPDGVVAFPGGKGTEHCVDRARRLGIPWVMYEPAPVETQPEEKTDERESDEREGQESVSE